MQLDDSIIPCSDILPVILPYEWIVYSSVIVLYENMTEVHREVQMLAIFL